MSHRLQNNITPLGPAHVPAAVVAEYLNLPEFRIYQMARRGQLPHVRIGRNVRFDPVQIRRFVEQNTITPGGHHHGQGQ